MIERGCLMEVWRCESDPTSSLGEDHNMWLLSLSISVPRTPDITILNREDYPGNRVGHRYNAIFTPTACRRHIHA